MPPQITFEFLRNLLQGWWQSSLERECWVCLTYSVIYSHIQPFCNSVIQNYNPLLIYLPSLFQQFCWSNLECHPLLSSRGSINSIPPSVGCRLDSHMVLQQLLFQLIWERRSQNFMPIHFFWNRIEKWIQLTASSWRQISKPSLLYICISIRIFQLMWNICDCFFHCAAWVIIRALLVRGFYNRVYERFPPHLLWS